jgi:hypothetical protein
LRRPAALLIVFDLEICAGHSVRCVVRLTRHVFSEHTLVHEVDPALVRTNLIDGAKIRLFVEVTTQAIAAVKGTVPFMLLHVTAALPATGTGEGRFVCPITPLVHDQGCSTLVR